MLRSETTCDESRDWSPVPNAPAKLYLSRELISLLRSVFCGSARRAIARKTRDLWLSPPRPWDLSAHKFDEGNMRLSTNEASGVLTLDAWPERRTATLSCAPSFDYLLIVYFRQHNSHRARPCRCPRFPRPPESPFENDRERKAPPRRNDSVRPLSSQNAPLLMVKHRNSPVTRSSTCARPLLSSHKARPYSLALSS